jgi:WD40 repeat protein
MISDDGTALGNGFDDGFAFTPDGKLLLSCDYPPARAAGVFSVGGEKPALLLWDFPSGKLLAQSAGMLFHPKSLAIRPDGRLAACASPRGDILTWEPGKNTLRRLVDGRRGTGIDHLAFTADGKHLIAVSSGGGGDGESQRIEVASGKVVCRTTLAAPGRVALAADGTLATYTHPDHLCLYQTRGKTLKLPLKKQVNYLDLSFNPEGRTLVAMDRRAEAVQLWDTTRGELIRRLRLPGLGRTWQLAGLVLSADRKTMATAERFTGVRVWDARTGRPLLRMPGHVAAPHLAFAAGGKEVVSHSFREGAPGGELYRWDAATGKPLAHLFPQLPEDAWRPDERREWQFSPDGRHLAAKLPRSVYLFDTRTGKPHILRDRDSRVTAWAFSPDGQTLVTTSLDRSLRPWQALTGKLQKQVGLGRKSAGVSWLCVLPGGRGFVTGEGLYRLHLWGPAGEHRASLRLPPERRVFEGPIDTWQTACTPDGRHLFISNATNLWVWDLELLREVGPFEEDDSALYQSVSSPVAVSADGQLLAWFNPPWKLRLHEVASGRIVHRFEGGYSAIAFAPSGWRLATGCNRDSSVLVWDLRSLFLSRSPGHPAPSPESLWADLSASDAVRAHRALWRLASLPDGAAFLARRLLAVERVPADRLRALLADLGGADLGTRRKAERTLAEAREGARAAMEDALRSATDLELRLRLGRLLDRLRPRAPERLREARAVMALEVSGTPEARRLLVRLAEGLPEARLTQEAKAALRRLPAPPPTNR